MGKTICIGVTVSVDEINLLGEEMASRGVKADSAPDVVEASVHVLANFVSNSPIPWHIEVKRKRERAKVGKVPWDKPQDWREHD